MSHKVSEDVRMQAMRRLARARIQDALERGIVTPWEVGIKGQLHDTDEWAWDDDMEGDYGEKVRVNRMSTDGFDMERFIMSLPEDEGRVLAVRTMGFDGREGAKMAGFPSVWAYIRALRKLRARMLRAKELAA